MSSPESVSGSPVGVPPNGRGVYHLPIPSLVKAHSMVSIFVTRVTITVTVEVGLLLDGATSFREASTVTTTGAHDPETFGLVADTTRGLPNSRTALMTESSTVSRVVLCMPGSPTPAVTR